MVREQPTAGLSGGLSSLSPDRIRAPSRREIVDIQTSKLKATLAEVMGIEGFYRRRFKAANLDEKDIGSPGDLKRLPMTTKEELVADQEKYPPYGSVLTQPIGQYIRLHQTSGTKGSPLKWLDTARSWKWVMGLWGVIYDAAGVTEGDRFFFPFSFGPFLGFWAAFDAANSLGHLSLPGGAMTTLKRLEFMIEHKATVVACTPTYALRLAEVAAGSAIDLAASPVRMLIVAGEPGGSIPETRSRIEAAWGARCFDHWGMTEAGPLGFECLENPGGIHLAESECIAEVIDPKSGEPIAPGERGELVITPLGRLGSPLLRYRTGDLVCVDPEPCPCGRNDLRLKGGILGRLDDMVFIRGNNFYPSALEAVMRRFPEIVEYRAEVSKRSDLDVLSLAIETSPDFASNNRSLCDTVALAVKDAFNFRPEVSMAEPGSLPRFEMKASRFIIHSSYRKDRTHDR